MAAVLISPPLLKQTTTRGTYEAAQLLGLQVLNPFEGMDVHLVFVVHVAVSVVS
jgi:hypothetical protein